MFVWRSTYENKVMTMTRQLVDAETFRLELRGKLEQLKKVNKLNVATQEDLRNERDALKSQLANIKIISSDCRSEDGITIGLIDALIVIGRILNKRDVSNIEVQEALADLREDEDRIGIVEKADTAKRVIS